MEDLIKQINVLKSQIADLQIVAGERLQVITQKDRAIVAVRKTGEEVAAALREANRNQAEVLKDKDKQIAALKEEREALRRQREEALSKYQRAENARAADLKHHEMTVAEMQRELEAQRQLATNLGNRIKEMQKTKA